MSLQMYLAVMVSVEETRSSVLFYNFSTMNLIPILPGPGSGRLWEVELVLAADQDLCVCTLSACVMQALFSLLTLDWP